MLFLVRARSLRTLRMGKLEVKIDEGANQIP
uniref:Uncharacterized protein n=1 Tax=Planktothrix pseudagardhii TaxID=132604 RepID=A0A9W4GAL5_9CYAN|nr:hypothetical protein NO713_04280 [Planktothrix pseudagardhii]